MTGIRLFISYSHDDAAYVKSLTERLESAGIAVVYDRDVKSGDLFLDKLSQLIETASAVLVVVGPKVSDFMQKEVLYAQKAVRPVIPLVRAEGTLPLLLANLQWIDARTDEYPVAKIALALGQTTLSQAVTPRIYAQSDSTEFFGDLEALMREARSITLIGTGLNALHREALTAELMRRAAKKECRLAIYLADPESQAVQTRLMEEELGEKPQVGVRGLRERLDGFLRTRDRHGRPEGLEVRLFAHYPTFALLIVDDEYFIYPYGFARLGNYSPVLRFSKREPEARHVIDFLDQHLERVHWHSVDAQDARDARQHRKPKERLRPFALFFIPQADSRLYRFGSDVLGYDVREHRLVDSRWAKQVGGADEYGFHLTVVDVLYFLDDHEVAAAAAEAEFLFREIGPIELENLRVVAGMPHPTAVSLSVDDPTRRLEALHSELVARAYRRSVGSNYTIGRRPAGEVIDPADFFARRYQAPYVLQRYRPHFTLLSTVPPARGEAVAKRLQGEFDAGRSAPSVRVNSLCVMDRPDPAGRWVVYKEIWAP